MKLYISADMEGVTGATHWDDVTHTHPRYPEFRDRMTSEVVAACEGAIEAGASEIFIKDAHGTGRNILAEQLPRCTTLIRGWSGHPFQMVEQLDETFDALAFVGYHSKNGSDANPLAHTFNLKTRVVLNGQIASEFLLHAFAAALVRVPIVFLSGDAGICHDATKLNPHIQTVAVNRGIGPSTTSIAPVVARELIKAGIGTALKSDLGQSRIALPDRFEVELQYGTPVDAYQKSWYPGAEMTGPVTIGYKSTDYFEILRALRFLL